MSKGKNSYRTSRLVLLAMLWLSVFVLSVKVFAAWKTISLTLWCESLHTLIAGFSILLSLLATIAPDRPSGREIYGHGKKETAIAFLLAIFFGFACLNLLWISGVQLISAFQQETPPISVEVTLPLMQMLGVIVVTNLAFAILGLIEARILRNPHLRFNSQQLLKDAGFTLLVLGSFVGIWWGLIWVDLLLPFLLIFLAVSSFRQTLVRQLPLMIEQVAIAPEVLAKIAYATGAVSQCDRIQSRGIIGRFLYVQMHLILYPEFADAAGSIAEEIEASIRERFGPVQITFFIDHEDHEDEEID
ncbi:MAG: cation transporter [Oscillatoria sp. PMC 1068.18]|nr:cation transporter [Oscillatoria sp. PMC 1076.18]MEC4988563.1 cation transporter [Oscillatoria sp. PMC 1068.18]